LTLILPNFVNFGPGLQERQNTEGCKIVTHFSNVVWPSAMKFGTVLSGTGA